jgi:hypothetical protein
MRCLERPILPERLTRPRRDGNRRPPEGDLSSGQSPPRTGFITDSVHYGQRSLRTWFAQDRATHIRSGYSREGGLVIHATA